MARRRRLGEVLVADGVITELDLARALEEQNAGGGQRRRLGSTLIAMGVVDDNDLAVALANQLGLDRIDLAKAKPDLEAVARLQPDLARRHHVLPVAIDADGTLVVAMVDPTNVFALDELRMATDSSRVRPVVATESAIAASINRYYPSHGSIQDEDFQDDLLGAEADDDDDVNKADIESKPIVRLANTLIIDAMRLRASDIHVEPTRDDVRVRFRVDGILTEVMKIPRPARAPLTSRLKLMAGMDISERRRPQDGRTAVTVHGEAVDLRVSSMPSMHGEKIVMRLLRRGDSRLDIDDLHLAPDVLEMLREALESPQGIVLITGPTGSGKTTTVYAGLAEIATITRNVITLEDPIEYELDLVNQTQVNPRIGFTFAVGMRTVLRQDPDVVMVGEIRDGETAELAFEAAMTGHLVLSTVHTNNAPATVLRMAELGVERHLIASSLSLIVAQRLVRVVCSDCAEDDPTVPAPRLLKRLRLTPADFEGVTTLRRGRGCNTCADTGYQGRAAVTEVLPITPKIRDLIVDGARESHIRNVAREEGIRSMRQDGVTKAMAGLTTFEEVVRATPDDLRLDTTALVAAIKRGSDGLSPHLVERRSGPRLRGGDSGGAEARSGLGHDAERKYESDDAYAEMREHDADLDLPTVGEAILRKHAEESVDEPDPQYIQAGSEDSSDGDGRGGSVAAHTA